jgi:CRISPR system Cascade subunit CasC
MFIQIHGLIGYPASLLVRDEAGLAKRLPFGGSTRTRISSQSLKRHWRVADTDRALGRVKPTSVRSRQIFRRLIAAPLVAEGFDVEKVVAVLLGFQNTLYKQSDKAKTRLKDAAKENKDPLEILDRKELTILGYPEVRWLTDEARALLGEDGDLDGVMERAATRLKEIKANMHALADGAGVDVAMFGRMITGDLDARKDAAVHVAHAFTVHAQESEMDFFTAVDDLTKDEETGSAHMGDTELTCGLFYGYVVVDVPLLVSNLSGVHRANWREGDLEGASQLVENLIHLIATVSPGAKLGSTAPYASADLMLIEAGSRQPRGLAYAFQKPVRNDLKAAASALADYLTEKDGLYERAETRWLAALPRAGLDAAALGASAGSIPGVAAAVAAHIRAAGEAAP